MSVQAAKDFLEKVKNDEDFRKKLGEFKDIKERLGYAKEAGYDFTPEELNKGKEEAGLTEDELDSVAGGVCAKVCVPFLGDGYIE